MAYHQPIPKLLLKLMLDKHLKTVLKSMRVLKLMGISNKMWLHIPSSHSIRKCCE